MRPLPYAEPDRLVELWSVPLEHKDQSNWVTAFNLLAFQQRAKSFEAMGGTRGQVCNIGSDLHGQPPERVDCENVMPSLFQTLGVKPILGRVLAEDENPVDNTARVLLIGERFWERYFNRDPNVIGKVMRVDGLDKTVIGVMPKNFYMFDDQADFWTPMNWTRTEMASATYALGTVARLKPGVSIERAQAEMDALAAQQLSADSRAGMARSAAGRPIQIKTRRSLTYCRRNVCGRKAVLTTGTTFHYTQSHHNEGDGDAIHMGQSPRPNFFTLKNDKGEVLPAKGDGTFGVCGRFALPDGGL